jgi:hypothetical protein
MKVVINGKTVKAKTTENLGYQGGYQARAVEFDGKEYIVIKDGGIWRTRTPEDRGLR